MNIIFIFLIIFVSSISFVGNAIAQEEENRKYPLEIIALHMQLEYRDSNGLLFAFVEDHVPTFKTDFETLHDILDKSDTEIVGDFEILTWTINRQYQEQATYSYMIITSPVFEDISVALLNHDGILVMPGDTLKISLKLIRPV